MKENSLTKVLRTLGRIMIDAPEKLPPKAINEEWTKEYLIVPLLRALGWDNPYEVLTEDSPDHIQDSIDFLLKPQRHAPNLCVQAKPLLTQPPGYRDHEQIKKGIEQSKARGSDIFVWTNGDTWQIFAINLPNAPIYEVQISQAARHETEIRSTVVKLSILRKDKVLNNPEGVTEQIRAYWREIALIRAFATLWGEVADENSEIMRKNLPQELAISSEEVREFLINRQDPRLSRYHKRPLKQEQGNSKPVGENARDS